MPGSLAEVRGKVDVVMLVVADFVLLGPENCP